MLNKGITRNNKKKKKKRNEKKKMNENEWKMRMEKEQNDFAFFLSFLQVFQFFTLFCRLTD